MAQLELRESEIEHVGILEEDVTDEDVTPQVAARGMAQEEVSLGRQEGGKCVRWPIESHVSGGPLSHMWQVAH